MSGTLARRAVSVDHNGSFFSFLRNWSSSTAINGNLSTSLTGGVISTTPNQKKKKKKKKNLFEVAQFLPNWGLGHHIAKSHWTNVSYEITKLNLYKDGRHGKAWGIAYVDGVPANAPKKISGVHKRCWKYIRNLKKVEVEDSRLSSSTLSSNPKSEVQAI